MTSNPAVMPNSSERRFAATRWSLVLAAGGLDADAARRALIELCLRYWYPVYAYARGCGNAPEPARELVQRFFAHLLEQRLDPAEVRARGRFRRHLLEALQRYLGTAWRAGSEAPPVPEFEQPWPWEELEARYQRESAVGLSPEQAYQRGYALDVLGSALGRLEREARDAGRGSMFAALKGWLGAEPAPGQLDESARRMGMQPLVLLLALKRLRQRYRELAEAELLETVTNPEDLRTEREALAQILGQTPGGAA